MMSEVAKPWRDFGPYETAEQVREQIGRQIPDLPRDCSPGTSGEMLLMESHLLAGLTLTDFEHDVRLSLAGRLTDDEVQVIAGWIMRSYLEGRSRGVTYASQPTEKV